MTTSNPFRVMFANGVEFCFPTGQLHLIQTHAPTCTANLIHALVTGMAMQNRSMMPGVGKEQALFFANGEKTTDKMLDGLYTQINRSLGDGEINAMDARQDYISARLGRSDFVLHAVVNDHNQEAESLLSILESIRTHCQNHDCYPRAVIIDLTMTAPPDDLSELLSNLHAFRQFCLLYDVAGFLTHPTDSETNLFEAIQYDSLATSFGTPYEHVALVDSQLVLRPPEETDEAESLVEFTHLRKDPPTVLSGVMDHDQSTILLNLDNSETPS